MAKRVCDDLILERITRLEDQQIEHANALDVKLSYVLIALIFLGQIAFSFYGIPHLTLTEVVLTIIGTCCVVIAGIMTYCGLVLAKFEAEDEQQLEQSRDTYVAACLKHDPNMSDETIRSGIVEGFIANTKARMGKNAEVVNDKVYWLKAAYRVTFLAVALYVTAGVILIASLPH
jgi:hypothetical protein